MNLLTHIRLVLAQHRALRAALAELNGYSDRELGELGLARGDVPRIAWEEAERRVAALAPKRRETPATWQGVAPTPAR